MENVIWLSGHERLFDDIVRAENCSLFDSAGKRYVDLESGVWCTPIGHGHPDILREMGEQASQIAHTGFCYACPAVAAAADAILVLHGMVGGKCVFLCSGSEAVEYGVRAAQAVSAAPLSGRRSVPGNESGRSRWFGDTKGPGNTPRALYVGWTGPKRPFPDGC